MNEQQIDQIDQICITWLSESVSEWSQSVSQCLLSPLKIQYICRQWTIPWPGISSDGNTICHHFSGLMWWIDRGCREIHRTAWHTSFWIQDNLSECDIVCVRLGAQWSKAVSVVALRTFFGGNSTYCGRLFRQAPPLCEPLCVHPSVCPKSTHYLAKNNNRSHDCAWTMQRPDLQHSRSLFHIWACFYVFFCIACRAKI